MPASQTGESLTGRRVFSVISSDQAERYPRQLLLALLYLLHLTAMDGGNAKRL